MTLLQKVVQNVKKLKPSAVGVLFMIVGTIVWGVHEAGE
jgi:hypothetical protein